MLAQLEETYAQMVWRRFKRHKLALISLVFLVFISFIAIFAPLICPYDYEQINTEHILKPPSAQHLFGTDRIGRDIFSRIVRGSRISLSVGFIAAAVSVTIGTVIGALAGYFGGIVDDILMRFTEMVMSFPVIFLLLTIIAVVDRSILNVMLVIGFTSWTGLARIVRGQFLSLREMDYVEAAEALGASHKRIILRHMLLNCMAPIIVNATLRVGGAILAESGLSFLGLGVVNPPSWGAVLNSGRSHMRSAPWITLIPGFIIFLTVLSFNYIGDGLRDALDPHLKR
ncbi:ABC transporter permease [Clostridium sp. 'deep sea']|uniref:oligopeptide ABC transporter permease n=1 Tax=Clostridium sp. 'deep sea' TaxID=2779445 RepID=UPI0018967AC3|nr:oligopeptide ABC transporter permease [Clostridium sp. 'deep sea']QOR34374.1 ABC transporter permease [Clostridium sp. 'deep sea']